MSRALLTPPYAVAALVSLLAACGTSSDMPDGAADAAAPAEADLAVVDLAAAPVDLQALPDLATGPDLLPPPLWERLPSGTLLPLWSVWGWERGKVFAVGGLAEDVSVVAVTEDGRNFTARRGQSLEYSAVHGFGAAAIYLAGVGIERTRDLGRTFEPLEAGGLWTSIWGSSEDDLYVVGFNGVIVHSADRGASFQPQSSGVDVNLERVWGAGPDEVWTCGGDGVALRTLDGGATWVKVGSDTASSLEAVWGRGALRLLAGHDGTVSRSTDGGATFRSMRLPTQEILFGLWGASAGGAIWTVGGGGVIFRSDDDGATWTREPSGTIAPLFGLWGSAPDDVYAVSLDGGVLRRK